MDLYLAIRATCKVDELLEDIVDIHSWVKKNITEANQRYKQDADKSRRKVSFDVGEFVMVDGSPAQRQISYWQLLKTEE